MPKTTTGATGPLIGMPAATRVYASLAWRRLRRGRLPWGAAVVALLPAAVAAIGLGGGRWGLGLFDEALEVYFRLLLPLAPVVLCAPVVGEELENRTASYLFARPAPRGALLLGKGAAAIVAILPAFLLGAVAVYGVALVRDAADLVPGLPHLLRVLGALVLGVPVYVGVAAGVGTLLVRRPLLAGFIYILLVEELFGNLPGALKTLAVSFYLRVVAGLELGSTPGIWEPRPGPALAAVLALVIGALWLGGALLLVAGTEVREAR